MILGQKDRKSLGLVKALIEDFLHKEMGLKIKIILKNLNIFKMISVNQNQKDLHLTIY